jgi:hypothetical protein
MSDIKQFIEDLKELIKDIESHPQDDLREYLQMYCEYEINEIKYFYKKHFVDLPNDDEFKIQFCLIMQYLGIEYVKYPNK